MFARGVVYLHAAHLPVPKTLSAKSSVSISSKLIEIKGLQLQHFGHLRKTGGRGSYRLVHTTHHAAELRPHAPVRPSQRRTSPLPAVSASLCVLSASALDFLFPRYWPSTVDCQLSASSSPLTPIFPPLARPTLNLRIFNIFPTHRGRGVPWSDQFVKPPCKQLRSARSNHMHQTPVARPHPLRSSPLGAKITTLLEPETFGRPMVSNTKSGQRLGQDAGNDAQPRSASRPQVAIRRWGRKADRVRLGQRTLVG